MILDWQLHWLLDSLFGTSAEKVKSGSPPSAGCASVQAPSGFKPSFPHGAPSLFPEGLGQGLIYGSSSLPTPSPTPRAQRLEQSYREPTCVAHRPIPRSWLTSPHHSHTIPFESFSSWTADSPPSVLCTSFPSTLLPSTPCPCWDGLHGAITLSLMNTFPPVSFRPEVPSSEYVTHAWYLYHHST